jgi:hypothetical protein
MKQTLMYAMSCHQFQELPVQQRGDAVSSLVYEANARVRDPVYGCVGAISFLQNQVSQLQMQLAVAQAEILCIQMQQRDASQSQLNDDADHSIGAMQQMVVDDAAAAEAFLMQNGGGGFPQQLMSSYGGGAPASNVHLYAQDHLKRESLWT